MMLIEKYDFSTIQKGLPSIKFVIKVKIEHFSMKHFSRKSSFFIMVNSLELWWNSIVVVCGGKLTCLLLLKWHQARNSGKSMHTFSLENKLLELQIGRGWQNHQHVFKYLRPTGLMMVYSCAKFLIWKMRCCLLRVG